MTALLREIVLDSSTLPFLLQRSKRRTIGLRIDSAGLKVSIPLRMSEKDLAALLVKKGDWILQKMREFRPAPVPQWFHGAHHPYLGKNYPLRISAAKKNRVELCGEEIAMQLRLPEDPLHVEEALVSWYRKKAQVVFRERIEVYAAKLGKYPAKILLSSAKTRWGSCNSRGEIRLNWRLIRMAPDLIDYVVAHELAHLLEMNHSAAFWRTVEQLFPDYKKARSELRNLANS